MGRELNRGSRSKRGYRDYVSEQAGLPSRPRVSTEVFRFMCAESDRHMAIFHSF